MIKTDQSVIGRVLLKLLVISFVCGVAASGHAQEAASFYKGETITFLVTVSPGGGFDMYARMIAPFLEKETGANVAVQNMIGGEGNGYQKICLACEGSPRAMRAHVEYQVSLPIP